jgi:O-antigen ligase
MSQLGSRASDREIIRGLALLLLLLPIFYFPNLINLYRLPKETFLAFLVAVLAWLWVTRLRGDSSQSATFPLLTPLAVYLAINGLSLANAVNALEGARHLLHLALGIVLFWLTFNVTGRASTNALFRAVSIGGAVVSVVGILQALGLDLPTLVQVSPPSATFGNKNMAAQYLLFALPASLFLVLSADRKRDAWIFSFLAGLITTYFIYARTRAAWGAVAVTMLILWFSLRLAGLRPDAIVAPVLAKRRHILAITAMVIFMNLVPTPGTGPKLGQLQTFMELERDASALTRLAIWANSLAIFKDHPLLGVGIGNFQFNYPLYNRRVIKDQSFSVEQRAAEVHNDYIQLMAETGTLGILAFFVIILLIARKVWRSIKSTQDPTVIALTFALVAILLEAFWDFPFANPTPIAFFWIYAGLVWRATEEDQPTRGLTLPLSGVRFAVVALALVATLAAVVSFLHLRGEFYYSRALAGRYEVKDVRGKLDRADEDFEKAIYFYPYDFRYHHWKAVLSLRKGDPHQALQDNLQAVILNPYHINTLNNLGVIYTALGNPQKAIQAFETTLKIWPDYVNVHNNLGELYERAGDREKAADHYREALKRDPRNRVATGKLAALLDGSER